MFHLSRTQLLQRAILAFVMGATILIIFGPFDTGGAWDFAMMCFIPGLFFLGWRQLKGVADQRATLASRAEAARPMAVAPPAKASPESSSLELPEFD